ncbi:MAG: AsmA family protein [Tepidisphaeraceae bacterium]
MRFLKEPVERKLSAALGARVSIEKLNLSLLGSSLDVSGITVLAHGAAEPLLTVRRVKADVAMGAILRKEVSIKSIVIEGPVLTIVRQPDGSTNLPTRDAADTRAPSITQPQGPDDDDAPSAWNVAAAKVQLFDGSIHFRDGAYHASAQRVIGELLQKPDGIHVTLLAQSIGRRDEPLDIGEARANGVLGGVESLANIASATRLDATFDIADLIHGSVRAPALAQRRFDVAARAKAALGVLRRLVPARLLPDLRIEGNVELDVAGSFDARSGWRGTELNVRVTDFTARREPTGAVDSAGVVA